MRVESHAARVESHAARDLDSLLAKTRVGSVQRIKDGSSSPATVAAYVGPLYCCAGLGQRSMIFVVFVIPSAVIGL